MPAIAQDFRHALRALIKAPGFTASAIAVLALGIGANTAIFTVVDTVLLRPLPFPEPDRLVRVWHVPPQKSFPGTRTFPASPANYLDWRAQSDVFDSMAAYKSNHANLTGKDRPESVLTTFTESAFFRVTGVSAALGRTWSEDDDRRGSGHVAVLSHGFWESHFGGSPSALNTALTVNGEKYTVIGVMPARFTLPAWGATSADLFVPMAWDAATRAERKNHNYNVIARLKPGIEIHRAIAQLSTISLRLETQYPEADQGWGATAVPLREQLVGDVRPALLLLLGAVAFVLLIACANVANLVLARTLGRRKELAIRVALGASRARTLRKVMGESLVLSLAGGAAGLAVAHFGVKLITAFLADQIPRATEVRLDAPVLAFTLAVSLITGLLAGLWPAWRSSRVDINDSLRMGSGRGDSESSRRLTRSLLVTVEVALSLVLLIGAGLTIRSLWILSGISPGLDPHNVLTMNVAIPAAVYSGETRQIQFFNDVLRNIRNIPGVEFATAVDSLPLTGGSIQPVVIEGRPAAVFAGQPEVAVRRIGTQYLRSLRIPVLRGRDFTEADTLQSNPVVLVSESMAKQFWPGQDPIGQHLVQSFLPDVSREVVGVVGDVKDNGLAALQPLPTLYDPHTQFGGRGMSLVVRTKLPPASMTQAVINAVRQVDRELPVTEIKTMDDVVAESLSQRRFTMMLLASFAGLALTLAAVGIYSVLSYTVRKRLREISIRMAVGAQVGDVLQLVVMEAMKPAAAGILLGLAAAQALSGILATQVFGIAVTDPATYAAVSLGLAAVSLMASVVPAWRATRVDPLKALRND